MKDNRLGKYTESYNGKCVIIPCGDFEKMEGNFDNIKEEIIDAFRDERIISNWNLKEGIFKDGELIDDDDEVEDFESEEDYIWQVLVCPCMKTGFFVIYESPVPCNVKKLDDGSYSYHFSWGYTQTNYIHLEDLTQLSSILKNIDEEMKEQEYKKNKE